MAKMGVDRTVLGKILNHKGLAGDSHVTAIYDRYSYAEEKREVLEDWSLFLEKLLDDENWPRINTDTNFDSVSQHRIINNKS